MDIIGDFYTVARAAEESGLKYKTLLQRIARGTVDAREFGRMKLIPSSEVSRLKKEVASERSN
jgi:hypothetical protein